MKKLLTFFSLMLLAVCSFAAEVDITSRFAGGYCWNSEAETITANDDGSITYSSAEWGGIATWYGGSDLSAYEKIVFEFAEPTTVNTQIKVDDISAWGEVGITSLECSFVGKDVTNVQQIALQTSAATTLVITKVYYVESEGVEPDPGPQPGDTEDILPGFTSTWNESESVKTNDDGSKEYTSVEWGGMSRWYGSVDWSAWDALIMEFAEPTTCNTQILVGGTSISATGDAGITSLTCEFGENDRSAVEQVALQTSAPTTITVTKAYLVKYEETQKISYPITATWDFADETVMTNTVALSTSTEAAEVDDVEQDGIKMTVLANGAAFRNNGNNIQVRQGAEFQIPVNTTDDVITVKGYPGYSYYTIGGGAEITNTNDNPETTYSPSAKEVKQGYVSIVSTNNNNYFYSISVTLNEPKEAEVLNDLATTATFPFHEGTEGQKAEFGDQADYFLNSKVQLGSNMGITGKRTFSEIDWTKIQPATDTTNDRGEGDYIEFLIQPKFGITFTPSDIALKVAKYGTNNGTLDIVWVNPDGTEMTLATGVAPQRNNADPAYSTLTYEVADATVAEGACGVRVYVYGKLAANKDMDFCDITINGTLDGQEKEMPMLDSFTANGEIYNADDVFEADGDQYTGTVELSKTVTMISADNPLTAEALSGEVGEISYSGDETSCTATIPVAIDDMVVNYIVTFTQKPDFTLTYINTDDTEMGTQSVEKDAAIGEFAVDYTTAIAEEGMKVRGWFYQKSGGQKYTTDDIITEDTKLYAVATEIEESSTYKKYTFDLTSPYFYQEDHEAFTPEGSGVWHDTTHGWVFKNGDKIALLVGPKATITMGLCRYSDANTTLKFTDAAGNELGSVTGVSESDGELASYNYEGEAGTIYMEIVAGGAVYLHNLKIVNTTEVNFESQGDWYVVKANDASSLVDVLDYLAGQNSAADASRKYIFLPNGTYDFGYTALTPIAGNNISIIGQSTDGVIIKNIKEVADEGIGTTATLLNSSKNLYMQDLTLKNELDYYSSGSAGRGVCFQDKGDRSIFKNVTMLSYQDTYYSQGVKQSYWETSDLHGTVDFICGGGDVRFQDCTLSLEPRNANGTGGRTITAPTTTSSFGYVFDGCKVVDLANGAGDWNFGRTWQNEPMAIYLNTTLDENAAKTLISSRWTEKGMNSKDPKLFGEYGTKDAEGNDITPESNIIASHGGNFQTILTADEAAGYAYDKMFTDWDPASLTVQMAAPEVTYADGIVSWTEVEGAIAYAVFVNDEFQAIVEEGTEYDMNASEEGTGAKARAPRRIAPEAGDIITVRAANSMGGFGEAGEAEVALPDYDFDATEWVAGDPGRISPNDVAVDTEENTITVNKSGQNNIALVFDGKKYNVSADNRYFIILATGISQEDGASYLWWLNNKNNGTQIAPTVVYEEDGMIGLAWDLKQVSIAGTLGSEDTVFEKASDWSTTFGLTLADENTPAVISYIGFTDEISEPVEEKPYEFIATEWQAGDPGRISEANVTADAEANTITVDKDGAQNVNLQFKGTETYTVAAENKYFVIRAKGTTPEGSQLWWMNNTWIGTLTPEIYTDGDELLYAWPLETMKTNGGSGEPISLASDTEDAYFTNSSQWSTCFGLTLADPATPAVISLIGFLEEIPETATSIRSINAGETLSISNALRNGKVYDLSGRKVGNVVKGGLYIVDGKKLLVK